MIKAKFILTFTISSLVLTGCASNLSNDSVTNYTENQTTSTSTTSVNGDLLNRLNAGGNLVWVEDPFRDLTGSNSLAVYLTGATEGCAVWVFENENVARAVLNNGILDFSGSEVYTGADSVSGLGIIFVSPYAGADCEFVAADVLGWGK